LPQKLAVLEKNVQLEVVPFRGTGRRNALKIKDLKDSFETTIPESGKKMLSKRMILHREIKMKRRYDLLFFS